jgi:glycosyltransferase involved in cell wall biosynthesis
VGRTPSSGPALTCRKSAIINPDVAIALDATYSLGRNLSGVGAYSREILHGLAHAHPAEEFLYCYRPHRFLQSYRETLPGNAVRRLLIDTPPGDVFHALNQRVDTRARRTVSTFHDLFVMTSEYSSPEFRARFTEQARSAAEKSDAIIAVSQFTAGEVERLLGITKDRIRVIHHGVRSVNGRIAAARDREELVLCVGAIQKRKNVARLVRAFERLPKSWRLALAGAPDGYGAAEELRAVEESPRRTDVDVLGYVSPEALASLYRRAAIFAFPSLDEGFGMPVLEAMSHGAPVVTSQSSALPEVAGDAAILVDPFDPEAIAEALLRFAGNADLRDDFARRGIEHARGFTWESAVEQTWRVYNEIR